MLSYKRSRLRAYLHAQTNIFTRSDFELQDWPTFFLEVAFWLGVATLLIFFSTQFPRLPGSADVAHSIWQLPSGEAWNVFGVFSMSFIGWTLVFFPLPTVSRQLGKFAAKLSAITAGMGSVTWGVLAAELAANFPNRTFDTWREYVLVAALLFGMVLILFFNFLVWKAGRLIWRADAQTPLVSKIARLPRRLSIPAGLFFAVLPPVLLAFQHAAPITGQ